MGQTVDYSSKVQTVGHFENAFGLVSDVKQDDLILS